MMDVTEQDERTPHRDGMTLVGWLVVDDDHLISLQEEQEFGHCYRELRPVFVESAR